MRKILTIVLSLAVGISNGQAAQVVTDPTTYQHLISHAEFLSKMTTQSLHMRDKMYQLNNGIGASLGAITSLQELVRMGLLIAGKCKDPFADLAGYFLGLGKFKANFDFCSLVESRTAFDSLLFLPYSQTQAPTPQQAETFRQQRQQMIRESVSSTLSVTSMQKKEVMERRGIINERMREAMASKNLREDIRHSNILLSIIAQELTNIRILLIQQSEVQASTATEQVVIPVR